MTEPNGGAWPEPGATPSKGDTDRWRRVCSEVRAFARERSLSRPEVARRADIKPPTLYQVLDGSYPSSVDPHVGKLENWLASERDAASKAIVLPRAPGYIETPTAKRVTDALLYAQLLPTIVVINLGAGMGKTMTCRHLAENRPHTHLVTMRPTTASVHPMMMEIAAELDVQERNPRFLDRAVGDRLRRNGRHTLLIVDEAQHLKDEAVNQLRYLLDSYGVGIALVGNEELYGRFGSGTPTPAYAQIHRRIGLRVKQPLPTPADVELLLDGWAVGHAAVRKVGHRIAGKPGALGQLSLSLMMAAQIAMADGREINAEDLKAAWQNRGGESL